MVDNALEFTQNESSDQNKKLNRKTLFVGNATQITNLPVTTEGMLAYCIVTGETPPLEFTKDRLYSRMAGNTVWSRTLQEMGEVSSAPVSDTGVLSPSTSRNYVFFTLPTTAKFYVFTAIEWKINTGGTGLVMAGVDVIDANPPTLASTPLIAVIQATAKGGTGVTQKVSVLRSGIVRGGVICGAWINTSVADGNFKGMTGQPSINVAKATGFSATPATSNNTAWVANTIYPHIRVYYRGYI